MGRFSGVLDRIWVGITHHPVRVLVGLLVITLFFLYQVGIHGVPLDNSPKSLLVSDDVALQQYNQAIETFGDDRVVILALMADDVYTPNVMARLRALTRRIEGVDSVARAISLTNIDSVHSRSGGLHLGKLIPTTASSSELHRIAREVEGNRLIVGNLVSRDRKMLAINIFFKPGSGEEVEKRGVAEIERIVKNEFGHDRIYLAGIPYMNHRNDLHVVADLMKLAPLMLLLVVATFYFAFGDWRGVGMPLATVVVGLVWTFGAMALLGRPLTMVTMMVPVIIMAIGSSYVIHVLNQVAFSEKGTGTGQYPDGPRPFVLHALRHIGPAVIVSGLTTMAGFASLSFTRIVGMRDMGLFNAVGVCATMLLSLTLVPAWLILLKPTIAKGTAPQTNGVLLDPLLDRMSGMILRRRKWICGLVFMVTLASIAGISRLRINSDTLAFYPEESEERRGAELIQFHLGGAAAFRIIVEGPGPQALQDVDALRALGALQEYVEKLPGVDRTVSVADMVMMTNRLLGGGGPEGDSLPESQVELNEIFSYLAQAERAEEVPIKFISEDGSKAQVLVRSTLFASSEMDRALHQIQSWAETNLPPGFSAHPTGILVLLNRTSDSMALQQIRSLAVALLLILTMITLLFGSVKTGVVALIPNLVPIVIFFGFMGWTGISLNLNTSLIASIVLGLAVDNAVHLIQRYRRRFRELNSIEQAVNLSLRQTGGPIIFANLTLVFGFAVFALSTFAPVRTGGVLSAVTILACLISDLVFLPVLLSWQWLQAADNHVRGRKTGATVTPVEPVRNGEL